MAWKCLRKRGCDHEDIFWLRLLLVGLRKIDGWMVGANIWCKLWLCHTHTIVKNETNFFMSQFLLFERKSFIVCTLPDWFLITSTAIFTFIFQYHAPFHFKMHSSKCFDYSDVTPSEIFSSLSVRYFLFLPKALSNPQLPTFKYLQDFLMEKTLPQHLLTENSRKQLCPAELFQLRLRNWFYLERLAC